MSEAALSRYWSILGLPPDASVEQIDTQYYVLIEKLPENPTEEEERQFEEIRRAYAVLRRACATRETKGLRRISSAFAARAGLVLGAGLLVGGIFVLAVNYKSLAVRFTEVPAGTELRVKDSNKFWGTVLEFRRNHTFAAGNPGPAYKVRMAETGEEVWVGERIVELGMSR